MFAVPGWSVSSSNLKTQTALPVDPITKKAIVPVTPEEDAKANEKKRKRHHGKPIVQEVDSTNLSELWEKVIEGKTKLKQEGKSNSKDSKSQKRQKVLQDSEEAKSVPEVETEVENKPSHKTKKLKTLKEKKREIKAKAKAKDDPSNTTAVEAQVTTRSNVTAPKAAAQLTPLQAAMRQKLISARFRYLNQTLYTTPSARSLELFHENPEMFQEYHEGFRRQVEVWPENPVDGYMAQIRARGKIRRDNRGKAPVENTGGKPLPRTAGTCHIADLGCGDAGLAGGLQPDTKNLNIKIYSYDLQSPSPLVTRADIANLPLKDDSVDIAIFCLALMGTNWIDFVEEAYRVLHWKGELWVAEIKSRFGRVGGKGGRVEHSVGNRRKLDKHQTKRLEEENDEKDLAVEVDGQEDSKQETDVSAFVEVLRKRGFVLQGEVDLRNRMFVKMHFVKGLTPVKGKCVPVPKGMEKIGLDTWKKKPKPVDEEDVPLSSEAGALKPCVYKLR
ncbi:methyltransferase-domain-containing protein [Bisporella sp. PMI_857]|nr:methyltransferase-domain-containing protein [Bisporella sp. PMI_857]